MSKSTTKAILFGLAVSGVVRIVWMLFREQSVLDAFGITLTSFAFLGFVYLLFRRGTE
jgi:hypothetical protein